MTRFEIEKIEKPDRKNVKFTSQKMKIILYGLNFAPERIGIGRYSGEFAEYLAKQNHQVTVICGYPYYPNWKIIGSHNSLLWKTSNWNGIKVIRCPIYVPRKPTALRRSLHLFSFTVSSLFALLGQLFTKPDVLFVVEPTVMCLPTAKIFSDVLNLKLWIHVQDFELDAAIGAGHIKSKKILSLLYKLQIYIKKRASKVSTISNVMLQKLSTDGVKAENLVYFPNWFDEDGVHFSKDAGESFRKTLGISLNAYLVLYSGNIGKKQGLNKLIYAINELREIKDLHFLICGEGQCKSGLVELAQSLELKNLKFIDLQPEEKFQSLLSSANLHLVLQMPGVSDLLFPSKLSNILAVGGRVLISAEKSSELGKLAAQNPKFCSLCDPSSISQLAATIKLNYYAKSSGPIPEAINYATQHMGKQTILERINKELTSLTKNG